MFTNLLDKIFTLLRGRNLSLFLRNVDIEQFGYVFKGHWGYTSFFYSRSLGIEIF